MSSLILRPLDPAELRLKPGYSLTGALKKASQEARSAMLRVPAAAGFLVLSSPPVSPKPVGQDTARILSSLDDSSSESAEQAFFEKPDIQRKVAALVFDGVVEVAESRGFVSGPQAYPHIVVEEPGKNPAGITGLLSCRALRFAQVLSNPEAEGIARWLYTFNSLPASPRRIRHLRTHSRWRNLTDPGHASLTIATDWIRTTGVGQDRAWIVWKRAFLTDPPSREDLSCKLYISPRPNEMPEVVAICLPILAHAGALAFKAAAAPALTLRPDKMVAYFPKARNVLEAAQELAPALSGARAHGVPFSACLDADGMLSWGIDPVYPNLPGLGGYRGSWRGWITRQLAQAMARAEAGPSDCEPWKFAMACLSLFGIDDESFSPPSSWCDANVA